MRWYERAIRRMRHAPMLQQAEWLWGSVRSPYVWLLEHVIARRGLERQINGTDAFWVLPRHRNLPEVYEPEVWQLLMSEVRSSDVVADVGACLGVYSIALARRVGPTGRVVAFEPDPANAASLERHVELNEHSGPIEVIRAAVGATAGQAALSAGRGAESALRVGGDARLDTVTVELVTLDQTFAGQRVDIVKIDVEGFEQGVLEGARTILTDRARAPRVLFIEVHPYAWPHAGTTSTSLLALLDELGYVAQTLDGRPLGPITEYGEIVARRREAR